MSGRLTMTGMSDIWVPYGALGFRGSPKFKSSSSDRISHEISSIQPWSSPHDYENSDGLDVSGAVVPSGVLQAPGQGGFFFLRWLISSLLVTLQ